jgi:hypothetical protein
MVTLWYLLVLAPVIAIPLFWWNYQRKQAAREREANERWQSVVQDVKRNEAGAAVPRHPARPAAPAFQPEKYTRRDRMLGPPETLAYFLLRSGLPEFEVLVRVSLDQIVTAPGLSGAGMNGRGSVLAQHSVDFLVCNRSMQPLAAVDVLDNEAGAALTAAPDFKMHCLSQAGVRYVRILRTALPKRQDVRAVVLGPAAPE